MKRQNLIIITIVVISVAVGIILGLYFYFNKESGGQTQTNSGLNVFSGFGDGSASSSNQKDKTNNTDNVLPVITSPTSTNPTIPTLRKISSGPVSGAYFVSKTKNDQNPSQTTGDTPIYFMERNTGHVYEATTNSLTLSKRTNATKLGVVEYLSSPSGLSYLTRSLKNGSDLYETIYYGLSSTSSANEIYSVKQTKIFPENLFDLSYQNSFNQVFYMQNLFNRTEGYISKEDGSGAKKIFESPYKEWISSWPNKDIITLNTKASYNSDGTLYSLNPNTKLFKKILGPKKGLTSLMSPDGEWVFVGESNQNSIVNSAYSTKTKKYSNIYIRTMPEKCVWSKKERGVIYCAVPEDIVLSTYPDVWYQGLITFNDNIWRIDVSKESTQLIAKFQNLTSETIDAINLKISPSEDYLLMTNKADLSLWGLKLK